MKIDFDKAPDKLVPAIVQDARTGVVLMLGYMNRAALAATQASGKVTFYSRSKQRLWTKGETSGNWLHWQEIIPDCDGDTLLIKVVPAGATCHTGADTCFNERNAKAETTDGNESFLFALERTIRERKLMLPEGSYTTKLFHKGINKIAQKVGEEAVELIIEAKDNDDEKFRGEAADLMYHLLVLLAARDMTLADVAKELKTRSK